MYLTVGGPVAGIGGHGLRFQSTEPEPEEKDGKGACGIICFPNESELRSDSLGVCMS